MDSEPSSSPPPASPAGPSLGDIPRSIMISGIGAIVLIISIFLNWYSVSVNFGGISGLGGGSVSASASGHSATDVAWIVFLLGIVALAAWIVELYAPTVELPVPAWQIAIVAGGISILLILFRMVSKPGGDVSGTGISVSLAYGIFVALLAAIAVTAGAYLRMQESQGGV